MLQSIRDIYKITVTCWHLYIFHSDMFLSVSMYIYIHMIFRNKTGIVILHLICFAAFPSAATFQKGNWDKCLWRGGPYGPLKLVSFAKPFRVVRMLHFYKQRFPKHSCINSLVTVFRPIFSEWVGRSRIILKQ